MAKARTKHFKIGGSRHRLSPSAGAYGSKPLMNATQSNLSIATPPVRNCSQATAPRCCLECGRRAFTNSRLILLAAFSCPLSTSYPLLYRPPVLRLFCTDETSSVQWTSCVLACICRQYAGQRQGTVAVQVATTRICNLSCCQDVIAPLPEEKYPDRYTSCCPGRWCL